MKLIVWSKEILDRPGVELFKGYIEVEFTNGPDGMLLTVLKRDPENLEINVNDVLTLGN